jgi:hypothetical protein
MGQKKRERWARDVENSDGLLPTYQFSDVWSYYKGINFAMQSRLVVGTARGFALECRHSNENRFVNGLKSERTRWFSLALAIVKLGRSVHALKRRGREWFLLQQTDLYKGPQVV